MSGDADSGTSSFTMNGGTLTSKNGHVFHVTNTNAIINLNGVKIVNEDFDAAHIVTKHLCSAFSGAEHIRSVPYIACCDRLATAGTGSCFHSRYFLGDRYLST